MSRKVFLILGIFILSSGLSFILYSFLQMKSNEEAENEALVKAKASIMENSSVHKSSEPISSSHTSIDYHFEKGDVIGVLQIPRLERDVAIIEGTDGEELKKGVGHYSSTSLPEQKDQIFWPGTGIRYLETLVNSSMEISFPSLCQPELTPMKFLKLIL